MRLIECHDTELMRSSIVIEFQARCAGRSARRIFTFLCLYLTTQLAFAECRNPVASIVSMQGTVEYSAAGRTEWHPARLGQGLCPGELVTVRRYGRAAVQFDGDVLTRLDQFSTLEIAATPKDGDVALGLHEGVAHFISRLKRRVEVITPVVNALVEGTEFTVVASPEGGQVVVSEGQVAVSNDAGRVRLTAGQAARISPQAAPVAVQVQPLDAARWAIYYPLVAWPLDQAITQSTRYAAQGRFGQALASIPPELSETLSSYRANLLLGVGRFDEAAQVLDAAGGQARDPMAVRAIMQLAQGQFAEARQSADAMSTPTSSGLLARSYVEQSEGRLDAALESVEQAIVVSDRNPLAWARKAELELTLANARGAEASAAQALAIEPGTVRARALQGFAKLLRDDRDGALRALSAATTDNPADPLGHFALGLLRIREGNAEAGRRELEIAVLLDPSNVEYRATLGRAYMAENEDKRAATQLELASTIDPASPSPRFFESQRRLLGGDVIGAISAGREALALNDNRLTLRSPELLAADRAARATTLGIAYQAAGQEAALKRVASDAVAADSASGPAHRLMARALVNDRRLEQARVSEQFQGFVFGELGQPLVLPEELVTALPALQGSRLSSLNETSALIGMRPYRFSAGLLAGSQETWGTSASVSGSTDRFEAGVGHFDYRSDGFFDAGKVDLSATRGELRWRLADGVMAFGDVLHKDLAIKDITQTLFTIYDSTESSERSDLVRLGLRFRLSPTQVLTAVAANESGFRQDEKLLKTVPQGFASFTSRENKHARISNQEFGLRLDGATSATDYQLGVVAGRFGTKTDAYRLSDLISPFFSLLGMLEPYTERDETDSARVSGQIRWEASERWVAHLRGAYVRFDNDRSKVSTLGHDDTSRRDTERLMPSVGLELRDVLGATVRGAFLQDVTTPSAGGQSLMPTRFAGFDASFDDPAGTRFRRLAVGFDRPFANGMTVGGEWSLRKLETSFMLCAVTDCMTRWAERRHDLHVQWPVSTHVAAEVAWQYYALDLDNGDRPAPAGGVYQPLSVRTEMLPVRLFVQMSDEWRTQVEVVRVRQDVINLSTDGSQRHNASLWLTNLRLEYGKPGSHWGVGLDVRNVFDQKTLVQDTDLLSEEPRTPLWYPERSVFVTARIGF